MNDRKMLTERSGSLASPRTPELSLAPPPRQTTHRQRGSDPYNTSGSFDRSKNWARVGKR